MFTYSPRSSLRSYSCARIFVNIDFTLCIVPVLSRSLWHQVLEGKVNATHPWNVLFAGSLCVSSPNSCGTLSPIWGYLIYMMWTDSDMGWDWNNARFCSAFIKFGTICKSNTVLAAIRTWNQFHSRLVILCGICECNKCVTMCLCEYVSDEPSVCV